MKKLIVGTSLLFIAISLTSCDWFVSDEWKEKYGTPELFLNEINEYNGSLHLYREDEDELDYDFEIKTALLEAGPFEKASSKKSNSKEYFTYENFISPANSGPNYCMMSVYSDGFIRIDHKTSLGPHQYVYFIMDSDKASDIVDLTFKKVNNIRKIRLEDEEKANEDGKIENFIAAMEEKNRSIYAEYAEVTGRTPYFPIVEYKSFYDSGELLNLIKETEYTPCQNYTHEYDALLYNGYGDRNTEWNDRWEYSLSDNAVQVEIYYCYTNRLNEQQAIGLFYTIDAARGNAILTKASGMVNQ